jgi:hypothetical protein
MILSYNDAGESVAPDKRLNMPQAPGNQGFIPGF